MKCPTCHVQIRPPAGASRMICPKCGSLIPLADASPPDTILAPSTLEGQELPNALRVALDLVKHNRKLEAIRHIREVYPLSLADAKRIADLLEDQGLNAGVLQVLEGMLEQPLSPPRPKNPIKRMVWVALLVFLSVTSFIVYFLLRR